MNPNAQTLKEATDVKDLLLEDYRYYGEWLQKNEESGEKRVNLYVTLLTAIPAVIVATAEKDCSQILADKNIQIILTAALAALLPFGIFIFLRLIKRNSVTDEFKFTLDNIRQQYMDIFDAACFLSYQVRPDNRNPMVLQPGGNKDSRKWVSLVYLVLFLNTLVFAVFLYLLFSSFCTNIIVKIIFVFIGAIFAISFQSQEIKRKENKIHDQINLHRFTHAGGILFRRSESNNIEFLTGTSLHVFPNGPIEPEEGIPQAALRVVFKETGMIARIIRPAGITTQDEGINRTKVKLYLMECLQQDKSNEKRDTKWMAFEEAYTQLSFPELKTILLQAHSFLLSNIIV